MQNDYALQTAAVKNFVCALVKKGIDQNALPDREKVVEDVKAFVAGRIIKNSAQHVNPYKFLHYFDVFDADNFHGREKLVERAARDLWDRFGSGDENVIRIVGRSGSGKSSFLRAGLVARFQQSDYRGDVRTVVFRPTDFQRTDGKPSEIVRSILDFVEQQTDLSIPAARRIEVCRHGRRAAHPAVEMLQSLLPRATNGGRSKLIFGVDQFEEIVDYLSDEQQGAHWYPVIDFIEAAGRSESVGVAYTLETSRKESLAQLPDLPRVFAERDEIEVEGYSSEFIRSIIEEPFRGAGYPLCREVVRKIEENAEALKPDEGPRTENSILPLIALRLSQLFDHIQNKRDPISKTDLAEATGAAFGERATQARSCIQLEEVEDQLDFQSLIEEEAKKAWQEGIGSATVDPQAIDYFLQPLVGIGGPNLNHLQLRTMQWPPYSAEQKLAESFRRRRLLVPAAQGLRLVHEAVIRHWPDALSWFSNQQGLLKKQALFRLRAGEWGGHGRPADAGDITVQDVDDAAEILSAYVRAWTTSPEAADSLPDEDKLLRDYCLFVFGRSRTPSKAIRYMGKDTSPHVCRAATYGMVELLETFRQLDPSCLELVDPEGRAPLHCAAWDRADAVKYLLNQGVNPAPKTHVGWPPIAAPIIMGRRDIFNLLLKAGGAAGLGGPNGSTMLHLCAQYGQVGMASILVELHDLDPAQPTMTGSTPLHYAAQGGELETFEYFARRSDITAADQEGNTPLHLAAAHGQASVVDYILNERRFRRHVDAENSSGMTALHLAAYYKHPEAVHLLLQAGDPNHPVAEVNATGRGMRPLHLALFKNSPDPDAVFVTVHALLGHERTDPNAADGDGNRPLAMASERKVQKLLLRDPRLDPSAPVSKNGETPLTISAQAGDWEVFRVLQERSPGVSGGALDQAGNTMLHLLSAKNAPPELIESTLSSATGDDLNALNKAGMTPLLLAVQDKNWALVRELLNSGEIDPTRRGEKIEPVLLLAWKMQADRETVGRLAEVSPALLTEKDYFGWTLLHRAVVGHQLDWIEWLKSVAPDPSVLWDQTDRVGRRPADLASPLLRETLSLGEGAGEWPRPKSWDEGLPWAPVEGAERADLIGRIGSPGERYPVNDEAEIHLSPLPFYDPEVVRLVRIKSPAWSQSALAVYYFEHADGLTRLDGTSPAIHEMNAKAPINLSAENVLGYLRFFCFFVRGEEGPFLVAEGPGQPEIPETLTDVERAELRKFLRPACFNGYDEENAEFLTTAVVYYSNALFMADFLIWKTGMIAMLNDYPLLADMSAKVFRPLT